MLPSTANIEYEGATVPSSGDVAAADADCDHDVGTHPADDVDGDVVEDAAIDEELVLDPDGNEHARQRHRRPQGVGQGAVLERHRLGRDQVGRDAAKRRGQLVEARQLGVLHGDRVEQQVDLLPFVEAARQLQSPFQSELQLRGVGALVLLAPEVLVTERRLTLEDHFPVGAIQQRLDLAGRKPGGVGAADQTSHAGSGDHVDRDPVFLEPGQDADVREPAGAATPERQSDSRAGRRRTGGSLLRLERG